MTHAEDQLNLHAARLYLTRLLPHLVPFTQQELQSLTLKAGLWSLHRQAQPAEPTLADQLQAHVRLLRGHGNALDQRAAQQLRQGDQLSPPRLIPVQEDVATQSFGADLERMQQQAQQAEGLGSASHVLTNAKGQRIYPDSLSKLAGKIAEQAGLGNLRFHDLRHTYASLMLSMGVPMEVVSEKLGHSRPSTTADIYQHVFAEEHERHTFALDDLLRPKPLKVRSAARPRDLEEESEQVA